MSPYEVVQPGGAIDHWNDVSGEQAMQQLLRSYEKVAWLNPEPKESWEYTQSTKMIQSMLDNRMYPLTVDGIEEGMNYLSK